MKLNCVNVEPFGLKHHAKLLHDVWTIIQNCIADPTTYLHLIAACQDFHHLHHTNLVFVYGMWWSWGGLF